MSTTTLRCAACGAEFDEPVDSCELCGSARIGDAQNQFADLMRARDHSVRALLALADDAEERGEMKWAYTYRLLAANREYRNLGRFEGWPSCRECGEPFDTDTDTTCRFCGEEHPLD